MPWIAPPLPPNSHEREVMGVEGAAVLLSISGESVTLLAENRDLPGRKIDGEWRFSRKGLLNWLGEGGT